MIHRIEVAVLLGLTVALAGCNADSNADDEDATTGEDDDAGDDDDDDTGDDPPAADVPTPTVPCPDFVEGDITIADRQVRVWVSPEADEIGGGPLVLYWHATGSQPAEVQFNFAQAVEAIVGQGGAVIAPYTADCPGCTSTVAGLPVWYQEDFPFADEIVGCAVEKLGIDPSRIHSVGCSAGGVHTAQMLYARSEYLASVATYSGGIGDAEELFDLPEPESPVPAIIVYGEEGDFLAPMSLTFSSDLGEREHFNVVCTHDFGHGIAPALTPAIWDFLDVHRFGEPSPWSDGLPAGYDDGCVIGPVEPPDPPEVPVTDEGVGTPCETDEDCPGGDVDFCYSQLSVDGYCTIEGCAPGGCEAPFVCCHDCSGPAAGMLPFEGSVCVFDELTSTLTATPVGCTCD